MQAVISDVERTNRRHLFARVGGYSMVYSGGKVVGGLLIGYTEQAISYQLMHAHSFGPY